MFRGLSCNFWKYSAFCGYDALPTADDLRILAAMTRAMKHNISLFMLFFATFMLLNSRERPWGDAHIMYLVAERLATARSLDIPVAWPPGSHRGPDGKIYSQYALGPSVASVPGVWLRSVLDLTVPTAKEVSFPVTSHLASAALAALACVLLFSLLRHLGVGLLAAAMTACLTAFGTCMFVYARYPFSETAQAACFTGLAAELVRMGDGRTRRRAVGVGLWAGLLLNTKMVFAFSLPAVAGLVIYQYHRRPAELLRWAGWGLVGFLPLLAVALGYDQYRWGSPWETGYSASLHVLMKGNTLMGLWGLLFSPGKSLLLFSPPLAISLFGLATSWRRVPQWTLALSLAILPPVLFSATYLSWSGDYCWGPRYIVFLIPVCMVPAGLLLDRILGQSGRRVGRALIYCVFAAGIFVQLIGSAFYWDHYIRIAKDTAHEWLGQPNRSGAVVAEERPGSCGFCFEDMHAQQWLPPFQPILGHYWLAKHVLFGDPWKVAERDAPWKRYTSLELDAGRPIYNRIALDWWGSLWLHTTGAAWIVGFAWLLVFLAILAVGIALWRPWVYLASRMRR